MFLAQGSPSTTLVPILVASGLICLLVGFVAAISLKKPQSTPSEVSKSPRSHRIARTIAVFSAVGFLASGGLLLLLLESYPTHGWRSPMHTTVIAGVDAVTGQPLHIAIGEIGEDPYAEWSCGSSLSDENELCVQSNVSVPTTITADGYASQAVTLSSDSPGRLTLTFVRSTPSMKK